MLSSRRITDEAYPVTPFLLFASAAGLASFGGIAALLRSGKPITLREFLSATMNSAAIGCIIAMFWYKRYGGEAGDPYFLLSVSFLAGMGGVNVIEMSLQSILPALLKSMFSLASRLEAKPNDPVPPPVPPINPVKRDDIQQP